MGKIGGNVEAILQQKIESGKNSIGEAVLDWADIGTLWGWLDFTGGDSKYTHATKMQESTHIFLMDYNPEIDRSTKDKRLIVNGQKYEVLLIDDPMELHQQIEISLKYLG